MEELWPHKGLLVLKFAGVDSISEAETLVGCELQVPRSQRSELQAGWNYVSDLVGCAVLDHGREIGRIEDVQFGAGEAPLLIVRDAAARLVEIPFAEAYLDSVDVERKQVRMKLPEGLLEVNAPLTAEEKREQAQGARKSIKHRGHRGSRVSLCVTLCLCVKGFGFCDEGRHSNDFSGLLSRTVGIRHHAPGSGNGAGGNSRSTICGSLPTIVTAPWTTGLSAAAKAWC